MVSKTACRRCGRLGNFNEVKLYPLPHDPSQSMFLCEACYRKMIFEKNQKKVQTKPCHQCGRNIPADARLCPYCGLPLRSESLRGSRSLETMCGFCGAHFIGSPTVCPSCGKRILQSPRTQDFTWVEGKRVTKNMLLLVVFIVGLVVGIIVIHMFLTGQFFGDQSEVGVPVDFKVTDQRIIDDNGKTAMQVFFTSNVGGEIRIADSSNRILGYSSFSSADSSKIIDIGDIGETIETDSFSIIPICQQKVLSPTIYSTGKPSLVIHYINIEWSFNKNLLEDSIQSMNISLTNIGNTPVYITSLDISIDLIWGPFSTSISGQCQYKVVLPGESADLFTQTNCQSINHFDHHDVKISLKDSNDDIVGEFTQKNSYVNNP